MPHINHQRGDTRRRVNLGRGVCSCSFCGNPRRHGWDNPLTRQEQKVLLPDDTRTWPQGRKGPKRFTLEKRHIKGNGEPGRWWTELKCYRTEKDRDHALVALRKSVWRYRIRFYQTGDKGLYAGPQYEYRIGLPR